MSEKLVTEECVYIAMADLVVGPGHRTSLRNIDALAAGMTKLRDEYGITLLQPIIVAKIGEQLHVVDGRRRFEASKRIGSVTILCRVFDELSDALAAVIVEEEANRHEPFTPAEAAEVAKERERLEREAAEERQKTTRAKPGEKANRRVVGNFPPPKNKGKSRDLAAKSTGYSEKTLRKVNEVKEAAKADPAKYGDLAELIDKPKAKVDAVHKELKRRQAEAAPIKSGKGKGAIDQTGQTIPAHLRDVYGDSWIDVTIREVEEAKRAIGVGRLAARLKGKCERYPWILFGKVVGEWAEESRRLLDVILDHLKKNKPYAVCPSCKGGEPGPKTGCRECRFVGLVPKSRFEELNNRGAA